MHPSVDVDSLLIILIFSGNDQYEVMFKFQVNSGETGFAQPKIEDCPNICAALHITRECDRHCFRAYKRFTFVSTYHTVESTIISISKHTDYSYQN